MKERVTSQNKKELLVYVFLKKLEIVVHGHCFQIELNLERAGFLWRAEGVSTKTKTVGAKDEDQ